MTIVASRRTAAQNRRRVSTPPGEGVVVLTDIRWSTYEALLDDIGPRHIWLTYDRGTLEIMAPWLRHESSAGFMAELVQALASAAKLPIKSAWSITLRRKDLERGLEPDRCFYIRNICAILGKHDIRLPGDPPPDLAIEVDIHSSSINRLGIYAALGVPEVWRFDGERFEVLRRRDHQHYDHCEASPAFPNLPIAAVPQLLRELVGLDDMARQRRLRAWVRQYARGSKRSPRGKKK